MTKTGLWMMLLAGIKNQRYKITNMYFAVERIILPKQPQTWTKRDCDCLKFKNNVAQYYHYF